MILKLFTSFFCIILMFTSTSIKEEYIKEYYASSILKAEGWMENNQKTGYWKYYHPNASVQKKGPYHKGEKHGYWYFYSRENNLLKEGHFRNGIRNDWWVFHNGNDALKVQYQDGQREGYALVYEQNKLRKALKYKHDKKVGEWTSIIRFKIDNPTVNF